MSDLTQYVNDKFKNAFQEAGLDVRDKDISQHLATLTAEVSAEVAAEAEAEAVGEATAEAAMEAARS